MWNTSPPVLLFCIFHSQNVIYIPLSFPSFLVPSTCAEHELRSISTAHIIIITFSQIIPATTLELKGISRKTCFHLFSHPTSCPIKYWTPIMLDNFLAPHTKTWHTSSTTTYTVTMPSPSAMQQVIPMHLWSKYSTKSSNILTGKDTSQVWKWRTIHVPMQKKHI